MSSNKSRGELHTHVNSFSASDTSTQMLEFQNLGRIQVWLPPRNPRNHLRKHGLHLAATEETSSDLGQGGSRPHAESSPAFSPKKRGRHSSAGSAPGFQLAKALMMNAAATVALNLTIYSNAMKPQGRMVLALMLEGQVARSRPSHSTASSSRTSWRTCGIREHPLLAASSSPASSD